MSSESVQPDIEPRTLRAATEHMTVIEEARSLFSVTTQSGSEWTVDLREPACTCPDFEHRSEQLGEQGCKHIRRVRLEVGQVDTDALETRLAETADDLEGKATDLEQRAQELADTANELRDALDRLGEVV
jgi:predicted nucleic acid-binding Zn finger protein